MPGEEDETRTENKDPGNNVSGVVNQCYTTSSSEEEDEEEEESDNRVGEIFTRAIGHGSPNVHVETSNDVRMGPTLQYNAPVTVNQHVHVVGGNGEILQYALKAPLQELDLESSNTQSQFPEKTNGQVPQGKPKLSKLNRINWRWMLGGGVVLLLLVTVLVSLIVVFVIDHNHVPEETPSTIAIPTDPPKNPNTTLPGHHALYLKEDWHGNAAKFSRPQHLPTYFVVISHTVTQPCFSYTKCALLMRNLQDVFVTQGFPDVGYNFMVGGDGNVYEGRGWDVTNMHTGYVRHCNTAISLIGNFVQDIPTNEQLNATQELIKLGIKLGKISPDYKLVAMSKTGAEATLSPGKNVYNIIQNWPHYFEPSQKEIGVCPYDLQGIEAR